MLSAMMDAANQAESDAGAEEAASRDAQPAAEQEIAATVEAILFASGSPLSAARIVEIGVLPGRRAVREAIAALNERYERMGCSFRIEPIAGGYQMLTRPEYHDVIGRLSRAKSDLRLSQAAMETLSIVAYRQPVLRADVEAIRGVACGDVLRGLLEKRLVKIVGRAEVLGRPMLYGTTRRFLEVFGLNSLKDLPKVEELRGGEEEARTTSQADAPPDAGAPGSGADQPPPPG
jgi:segregation and condensation protein B